MHAIATSYLHKNKKTTLADVRDFAQHHKVGFY